MAEERVPATPATFDPQAHPRRLNLGCGFDVRPGYVNVDMNDWHHPDLLADVRSLDFLPARHYEEIVAQDVLEHLPRTDTVATLAHWNRLLKMGGTIMLRVPNVLGVARMLEERENQDPARQELLIQYLFGTQAYTGDYHFTSFTRRLLEHYLERSGFRTLSIEDREGWLFDVRAQKVAHLEAPERGDYAGLLSIADDEAFVRACYREVLKREADPGGLLYFLGNIRGRGWTRNAVIESLRNSVEAQNLNRRT